MIPGVKINVAYGAEQSVRHQPALYFMPDLAQAGIEFLSSFCIFHGSPATDDYRCMVRARAMAGITASSVGRSRDTEL
jgi:hypothetical protein